MNPIKQPPLTTLQRQIIDKMAALESPSTVSQERFKRGAWFGYAMALAELEQLRQRLEILEKTLPKPTWEEIEK